MSHYVLLEVRLEIKVLNKNACHRIVTYDLNSASHKEGGVTSSPRECAFCPCQPGAALPSRV